MQQAQMLNTVNPSKTPTTAFDITANLLEDEKEGIAKAKADNQWTTG